MSSRLQLDDRRRGRRRRPGRAQSSGPGGRAGGRSLVGGRGHPACCPAIRRLPGRCRLQHNCRALAEADALARQLAPRRSSIWAQSGSFAAAIYRDTRNVEYRKAAEGYYARALALYPTNADLQAEVAKFWHSVGEPIERGTRRPRLCDWTTRRVPPVIRIAFSIASCDKKWKHWPQLPTSARELRLHFDDDRMRVLCDCCSVILVAAVVGSAIGGALAYVEVRPGAGLVRSPDSACRHGCPGRPARTQFLKLISQPISSAPCSAGPRSRTSSWFAIPARAR